MSSHKPIRIYMGGLILGDNTLYRLFCFWLFPIVVGKGLISSHPDILSQYSGVAPPDTNSNVHLWFLLSAKNVQIIIVASYLLVPDCTQIKPMLGKHTSQEALKHYYRNWTHKGYKGHMSACSSCRKYNCTTTMNCTMLSVTSLLHVSELFARKYNCTILSVTSLLHN